MMEMLKGNRQGRMEENEDWELELKMVTLKAKRENGGEDSERRGRGKLQAIRKAKKGRRDRRGMGLQSILATSRDGDDAERWNRGLLTRGCEKYSHKRR